MKAHIDYFKYPLNFDFVEETTGPRGKTIREKSAILVSVIKDKEKLEAYISKKKIDAEKIGSGK